MLLERLNRYLVIAASPVSTIHRIIESDAQRSDEQEAGRVNGSGTAADVLLVLSSSSDFKNESRQANREMNRRWGELANKMGTMVEDLVAPSLPRIVREVLGQEVTDLSVRRKRRFG